MKNNNTEANNENIIPEICLRYIDEREQPVLSKINAFSVEDIVDVVSNYFNLDAKQITNFKKCSMNLKKY